MFRKTIALVCAGILFILMFMITIHAKASVPIYQIIEPTPITLTYEPTNPVQRWQDEYSTWANPVVVEDTKFKIADGSYVEWYRGNSSSNCKLGFGTSVDGIDWTPDLSNPIAGFTGYAFFYVVNYDSHYYLFTLKVSDGQLYLYEITGYKTLTALNDGKPVYYRNTNTSQWDYEIYNPAVAVDDNGRFHMLLEGKASGGQFQIGYAYSDLTELNWSMHRSTTPVLEGYTGNPWLTYLGTRDVLLTIHGRLNATLTWEIRASYANDTSNLYDPDNWTTIPRDIFNISLNGVHICDPTVIDNFKLNQLMISYGYAQTSMYQAYYVGNLTLMFDSMTGWVIQVYDTSYPTIESSDFMNSLLPIFAVFMLSTVCSISGYREGFRNLEFSSQTFLASFAIGITILIWIPLLPAYLIILPILTIVGMWFTPSGGSNE